MGVGSGQITVWKLPGGSATRDYADVFLRYGVGLIGPGDAGPWRPDRGDAEFGGSFVGRFAGDVKIGDVFLLRTGVSSIRAVGIVAGEYMYLDQFDDVNGLDLQHGRRIRWCVLPEEYEFEGQVFGARHSGFSRIDDAELIDYALKFINSPPRDWQTAPLPDLPEEEPFLGQAPEMIANSAGTALDLCNLYMDRDEFGDVPAEQELVTQLVAPLLRELGWPPELIGVEWRRVDVALFDRLPRAPENCRMVIEAKRLGAEVESALAQAIGYAKSLGVDTIVVTDGLRYRMYMRKAGVYEPMAYANLARLKLSAVELFERMRRPKT